MVDLPSFAGPPPAMTAQERRRAWRSMWLVDHGFIRDIYCNVHPVTDRVWRSAQPGPRQLQQAKAKGIKTILNLRGRRDNCGSYILEREACHKLGLKLVDFPIRSRGALEIATIKAAAALFPQLEYPVLLHCKSGADRAGMMATLYLFLHEGRPLREAVRQLSLYYGHVKQAKTGVIDYLFETYLIDTEGKPPIMADPAQNFLHWIETRYDPKELNRSFKENRFAKFFVDSVLKRE